MHQRAKIDHEGIYWGPEEVDELGPEDIAAPDEVIRPGAYRWTPADEVHPCGRWVALEPTQVRKNATAPSLEQAFAAYIGEAPDGTLPAATRAWLDAYKTTIDGGIG